MNTETLERPETSAPNFTLPQGDDFLPALLPQILAITVTKDYVIKSTEEAHQANTVLGKIKGLMKSLDQAKSVRLSPLNEEVKKARADYAEPEAFLADSEKAIKQAIATFAFIEQKRIAEERAAEEAKQAKLRREAQAKAEAEQAVANAKAEALRQQAEDARAAGNEAAAIKLEGKAEGALDAGEIKANAAFEQAQALSAPVQVAAATKFAGTSIGEKWKCEVINTREFVAALLADKYCDIDSIIKFQEAGLNALVKPLKAAMPEKYPGCRAWPESTVSSRAR
jgi:hypothetical protein